MLVWLLTHKQMECFMNYLKPDSFCRVKGGLMTKNIQRVVRNVKVMMIYGNFGNLEIMLCLFIF